MKLRNLIFVAMIVASPTGCMNGQHDLRDQSTFAPIEISNVEWAELDLTAGYLSLSGDVREIEDRVISVDWAVGIEYAQVIGNVKLDKNQNPDYLRVVFTSDRVEWVGMDGNDYATYEFESDCQDEGYYCEPVIPAEGVSGVFESSPGVYTAVVNTHCSAAFDDYEYKVTAYVIDFSWPDAVRASDIVEIQIICKQI